MQEHSQWAGRCILNVKCINQSITTLSNKVPEHAVSRNRSWSLSFISEYFHVHVKRQMISLLHDQIIVMSSFRVCYTTFDKENKLTNMCLCFTKDMCHCCDYGNLSVQSCACDVTHVVAMQPAGNTCGCQEINKNPQASHWFNNQQIFLLWNAPAEPLSALFSVQPRI